MSSSSVISNTSDVAIDIIDNNIAPETVKSTSRFSLLNQNNTLSFLSRENTENDTSHELSSGVRTDFDNIINGTYQEKFFFRTLNRCNKWGKKTTYQAGIYKIINIFLSLLIVILACVVSVVSASQEEYYITAISTSIIGVQMVHELFQIGKKGIYLKYASVRLSRIKTLLLNTLIKATGPNELYSVATNVANEMDDLELSLFSMSYGPRAIKISQFGGDIDIELDNSSVHPEQDI